MSFREALRLSAKVMVVFGLLVACVTALVLLWALIATATGLVLAVIAAVLLLWVGGASVAWAAERWLDG